MSALAFYSLMQIILKLHLYTIEYIPEVWCQKPFGTCFTCAVYWLSYPACIKYNYSTTQLSLLHVKHYFTPKNGIDG